jgi:hypothetical protein
VSVAVLVPFTSGACPHRDRAWEAVQGHYAAHHPDWQVVTGSRDGEWVKALAVADALDKTSAETLVIADADLWVSPEALREAVEQAQTHVAAVPHHKVHRLSQAATEAFYDGQWVVSYDRQPYRGVMGGGIVVLRRDMYQTCPIDLRFRGWGGEDVAWGWALKALGSVYRGTADLWHLWHPTVRVGHLGSPESQRLVQRWRFAANRPALLDVMLDEAREATWKQ